MLSPARYQLVGQTAYAHEQSAIQHAIDELPSQDPYRLWALFELLDASSGRLYEYDLLVVGYSDIYHVEIKSGPGTYVLLPNIVHGDRGLKPRTV